MAPEHGRFQSTQWSLVLAAGRGETGVARDAIEVICGTYWQPLYGYVRRRGHGPEDAQDLTQTFFTRLLEDNGFAGVDPAKGKFRSFLLASLKHFLANEWDRVQARKRGGGAVIVRLDLPATEARYAAQLARHDTPEDHFERQWALALLERVMARLRRDSEVGGSAARFDALKVTLTGQRSAVPYAELAARLGMTEGALKVAVHRLRRRYRDMLRQEVAATLSLDGDVDEELRHLFSVLAG